MVPLVPQHIPQMILGTLWHHAGRSLGARLQVCARVHGLQQPLAVSCASCSETVHHTAASKSLSSSLLSLPCDSSLGACLQIRARVHRLQQPHSAAGASRFETELPHGNSTGPPMQSCESAM